MAAAELPVTELPNFQFTDRLSRNLGGVVDAGLRDLDDCLCDQLRIVAVLDA
jgi:hypothetical protein